ncbi:MAG TPA: ribosome small subunit-dependent GTPase A, partial [Chthonomonadaceae bacterium]|nr:ribosome small subunit-dependent GTPase A [Chthonomonadaceae bacterium]
MRNPAPVITRETAPAGAPPEPCPLEGLVLKVFSGAYMVQADPDEADRPRILRCSLRGVLKKKFDYSTSSSLPRRVLRAKQPFNSDVVAVGDRVRFLPIDDEEGIIEEVLPRQSRFARATFRGRVQTLVTNLDQLVIVFACAEPNPDLWRLDRWLVAAESNGLEPLIVANKRDLVDAATFGERFGDYERIGYRVLATSATEGTGIEELREALRVRISAFTGPSGVGKSSLLNALQPGLHLATADVGQTTYKGRHTTITRELIP